MTRLMPRREDPGPSQWIIIDSRPPGYIGQEIVDLSPGAIELRHAARNLRAFAERRENWVDLVALGRDWGRWPGERPEHVRDVSFGLRLVYAIDFDRERLIFSGEPVRHLAVSGEAGKGDRPTPATVGEVAAYFWGRRAAQMRFAESGVAHIVVGMNWEQLDPRHLMKLL